MNIPADLDDWTTAAGVAVGLHATRDPGLIHPPCLYVDLPTMAAGTLTSVGLDVPVFLVGAGSGKKAGDELLTWLPAVLDYFKAATAEPRTLPIGGVDYLTYQLTIPATLQE